MTHSLRIKHFAAAAITAFVMAATLLAAPAPAQASSWCDPVTKVCACPKWVICPFNSQSTGGPLVTYSR